MIHLTRLKELDFSSNIISFEGVNSLIKVLQKLENLIDLNISHNLLEPNGIKNLVKGIYFLTKLNKLNISCNLIRFEGLKYLVDVLKERCTLLTDLNLSGNEIGIYKSLPEVLNICNKLQLKKLYLNYNNFGSYKTSAKIDLDINTSLEYLDISFNYSEILQILSLDEIMQYYKSLSNIKLSNSYFKLDSINTIEDFQTKLKIDIV
jgi:Ran GTPase-activating protein (RanGAP) involved in mRNA processing and transport